MSATVGIQSYAVDDRVQVIMLQDHVDDGAIQALESGVRDAGVSRLVVDLLAVTRMSTHTLSVLIPSLRALGRERATFAVVCGQVPVARAIELAGLHDVRVFATVGGAVKSTRRRPSDQGGQLTARA